MLKFFYQKEKISSIFVKKLMNSFIYLMLCTRFDVILTKGKYQK